MKPFYIQKENVFAVPIVHYCMEMAAMVNIACSKLNPDCICVELPETMKDELQQAAARLPDISVCVTFDKENLPVYYLSEPCDPAFEALRLALENKKACFCIDLDVDYYPDIKEYLPDPYAITKIGLEAYYNVYKKIQKTKTKEDKKRELYMGKRLKELSLSYDKVLFVGGMAHIEGALANMDLKSYPKIEHAKRESVQLCTLNSKSCDECLAEFGWMSKNYEESREGLITIPDRQKIIYSLYKEAAKNYRENNKMDFPGYNYRNIMKFLRNYALFQKQLMPDLFQILTAAKGVVDHNFAYDTWLAATEYPYLKNIDNLPELDLTAEDLWGHSKVIRFNMKQQSKKAFNFRKKEKSSKKYRFEPNVFFGICSYPKEDVIVEKFGQFLQKKGVQIATEEAAKTAPFTTSIEDGIDVRETIRHWAEKKLYVKVQGKPLGGVGSVVVIFDEDRSKKQGLENYPWKTTWLGEHEQESDMAFYSTNMGENIVGPGISRCEYGGFMMSYPPRRMYDIWQDPDYLDCRSKSETLLQAAIDYSTKPIVAIVAKKPPRMFFKSYAARFGKKIIYQKQNWKA